MQWTLKHWAGGHTVPLTHSAVGSMTFKTFETVAAQCTSTLLTCSPLHRLFFFRTDRLQGHNYYYYFNANIFLSRLNWLNSSLQRLDLTNHVKVQLSLLCHLMSTPLCDSSANRTSLCAAKTSRAVLLLACRRIAVPRTLQCSVFQCNSQTEEGNFEHNESKSKLNGFLPSRKAVHMQGGTVHLR